jgi:hypothetical protein
MAKEQAERSFWPNALRHPHAIWTTKVSAVVLEIDPLLAVVTGLRQYRWPKFLHNVTIPQLGFEASIFCTNCISSY